MCGVCADRADAISEVCAVHLCRHLFEQLCSDFDVFYNVVLLTHTETVVALKVCAKVCAQLWCHTDERHLVLYR